MVRWVGTLTIVLSVTIQFPIKVVVKLLWGPLFAERTWTPNWIAAMDGVEMAQSREAR